MPSDERPAGDILEPRCHGSGRGVMEKCTYCIQRIRKAQIAADREERPIRDGEIRTACQQACPTEAIIFGDLNDPESAVNRRKASPLDYVLLDELNTRPRTTYQALIRNPNPEIGEASMTVAADAPGESPVMEPGVTLASLATHVSDTCCGGRRRCGGGSASAFGLSLLLFSLSPAWLFIRGSASGASIGRSPGGSRSANMSGGSAWRAAGPSSPPCSS